MKVKFLGAARTVTGSKHLITTKSGRRILLDCGFFQGKGQESEEKNRHLGLDPRMIHYLILSHAHIDHSGNIPYLVKQGYSGPIYCTSATKDLCEIMLRDSAHIQESDVKYINKRRIKRGQEPLKPLYNEADVRKAMSQFVTIPYDEEYRIDDDIIVRLTDSGHILGSAAVNLKIKEDGQERKICFTGDIGRYDGSILRDPQEFPECEVLICESTYGNRLHSTNELSQRQLYDAIHETCVQNQGKLIIPAFSLGRTQELVYALDRMATNKVLPEIPVYVDSPLSTNATRVIREHKECFNRDILDYMERDPDPFGFDKLTYIREVEASKALNAEHGPSIIISASGMMEAGRIKHHVANNIGDPKNTILIVGYAEPSSLGGRIRNGSKRVRIFGEEYEVKAKVVVLDSYSAHADYQEMIRYLSCQNKKTLKRIFLVHGEYDSQIHFKGHLQEAGFGRISIPAEGDEIEL
ncbi:MAG: MBL fold metallo-hydrolase [Bacteroidetes bacterium]|nr:MAG: MBL fold metallo-hydrolase [Bacteroidota bacterium]